MVIKKHEYVQLRKDCESSILTKGILRIQNAKITMDSNLTGSQMEYLCLQSISLNRSQMEWKWNVEIVVESYTLYLNHITHDKNLNQGLKKHTNLLDVVPPPPLGGEKMRMMSSILH